MEKSIPSAVYYNVHVYLIVEAEKLQSLAIEKDEELTQLNLKLTNLDKVVATAVRLSDYVRPIS